VRCAPTVPARHEHAGRAVGPGTREQPPVARDLPPERAGRRVVRTQPADVVARNRERSGAGAGARAGARHDTREGQRRNHAGRLRMPADMAVAPVEERHSPLAADEHRVGRHGRRGLGDVEATSPPLQTAVDGHRRDGPVVGDHHRTRSIGDDPGRTTREDGRPAHARPGRAVGPRAREQRQRARARDHHHAEHPRVQLSPHDRSLIVCRPQPASRPACTSSDVHLQASGQ
jgi:hypothetical protein